MYRLTDREINLETAEMDIVGHADGHIPGRDRRSFDGLMAQEGSLATGAESLDSSSSAGSGTDEEAPESKTLTGGLEDGEGHPQSRSRTHTHGHHHHRKATFEIEAEAMDPVESTRLTSMWAKCNLALLTSYFTIGFAMTFTGTPLTVYMVSTLNTPPAQLNVAGTMLALPWSFKILYGLLSDCVPIRGKRRKPYFLIGWSAFVVMNLVLAALGKPTLNALICLGFFAVCGYMMADVMCDAIIVERSKLEVEGKVGHMQAVGYVARYVGNVVGATLGTILYNEAEWGWGLTISQIFMMNGLVAVGCVLPFAYHLDDPNRCLTVRSLREQLAEIWLMVQRRTIYVPMCFVAVYNMLMIPNAAWSNFLILGLKFTPWMLGIMFIVATIFSWLGITFYRTFLFSYSWRWVYVVSTTLTVLFSILQLCLVFRLNVKWGINDLAFALGDDAVANFVSAMQFLPTVTMYISLCPAGSEGMAYSMLTTFSNVAGAIGSDIGTLLTKMWDVSNTAIEAGDWSGLWKLSLLTSLIQPLGLCLLFLLPKDQQHQKAMQKCDKRDFWGGVGFVTFLVVAWSWTLLQTLVYMALGK